MHGTNMKTVDAKEAKICYAHKNTRLKLLKTNAAKWFNKMCKIRSVYKHFYISYNNSNCIYELYICASVGL